MTRIGSAIALVMILYAGMAQAQSPHPIPPPPPAPPGLPPSNLDPVSPGAASETATGVSTDVSYKSRVQPNYPLEEYCNGVGGKVFLLVTIDENGEPTNVQVERSRHHRNLDRAAIDAVKMWKFNPAMKNDVPTGSVGRVPVNFIPSGNYSGCPKTDPEVLRPNEVPDATRLAGFEQLAAKGSAKAMLSLGYIYQAGSGVVRDPVKAKHWIDQAAALGNADAQYDLAVIYQNGLGVARDSSAARDWMLKAAAQGNQNAYLALGLLYMNGDGVPIDAVEAVKWFESAARQGNPYGEGYLGALYMRGLGVPQDNELAYAWFSMASKQVFVESSVIDGNTVKAKLTPEQVQEAGELVSNWKKGDLLTHPEK